MHQRHQNRPLQTLKSSLERNRNANKTFKIVVSKSSLRSLVKDTGSPYEPEIVEARQRPPTCVIEAREGWCYLLELDRHSISTLDQTTKKCRRAARDVPLVLNFEKPADRQ
jgi:hypothetical protein